MAEKNYVALTFDDGPNNIVTPAVLDRVEYYKIPATFFVNGSNISDDTADVMKRAVSLGCEYQNHSQNHHNMTKLSKEEIESEINQTDNLIKKYVGKSTSFFRPPFIYVNDLMFDTVKKIFICGQGSCDWSEEETKDETARIILSKVKSGDIILLHDSAHNMKTAQALDTIIPALLMEGYEFVTVSRLFELNGVTPKGGIVYSNINDK